MIKIKWIQKVREIKNDGKEQKGNWKWVSRKKEHAQERINEHQHSLDCYHGILCAKIMNINSEMWMKVELEHRFREH